MGPAAKQSWVGAHRARADLVDDKVVSISRRGERGNDSRNSSGVDVKKDPNAFKISSVPLICISCAACSLVSAATDAIYSINPGSNNLIQWFKILFPDVAAKTSVFAQCAAVSETCGENEYNLVSQCHWPNLLLCPTASER